MTVVVVVVVVALVASSLFVFLRWDPKERNNHPLLAFIVASKRRVTWALQIEFHAGIGEVHAPCLPCLAEVAQIGQRQEHQLPKGVGFVCQDVFVTAIQQLLCLCLRMMFVSGTARKDLRTCRLRNHRPASRSKRTWTCSDGHAKCKKCSTLT